MVVGRQQIILEFLEKFLAGWVLGAGEAWSWLAVVPLSFRRELRDSRASLEREICLLFAYGLAWALGRQYPAQAPATWVALALALASAASAFRWPQLSDVQGARGRNLLGFGLFGFGMTALSRFHFIEGDLWGGGVFFVAAALAAALHYLYVKRNGEPGLLIPGTALLLVGALVPSAAVAGAGFGMLLPAAYLVGRNMGGSWLLRGLCCAAGAAGAAYLPAHFGIWALAAVFVMSLETWRFALRWLVLTLLMVLYRFRIYGEHNVPYSGPAVLIGNHVSLLDGFLIAAHTQRLARFLVYDAYFKNPLMRFGLNLFRTIPISQGGKRDMIESLREARRRIEEGHVAGIFPEGSVTRSGFLNPYQKGITRVVQGAALQIVPAYMNGLWMSFVSFSEGGFRLTLPRGHQDLEIEYGEPIASSASHVELWEKVKSLEVNAAFRDSERAAVLPLAFLAAARKHRSLVALRGAQREWSYEDLAAEASRWAGQMERWWPKGRRVAVRLDDGEQRVLAYLALALAGRPALELPRQQGQSWQDAMDASGAEVLLTSAGEAQALGLAEGERVRLVESLAALAASSATQGGREVRKDDLAWLAQGREAWVPLSFRGLQAAAHAARRVLWMKPGVTVRCVASWESSAAFVLGLWTPLLHGATVVVPGGNQEVDFEIRLAKEVEAGSSRARHILSIERADAPGVDGENVYPVLEVPELSGIGALSAPKVFVAGDTQGGAKAGVIGQLPFGVEAKRDGDRVAFRSPQRCLPLDFAQPGVARPEDWVALEVPGVGDFGEVERVLTSVSSQHTS